MSGLLRRAIDDEVQSAMFRKSDFRGISKTNKRANSNENFLTEYRIEQLA